MKKNCTIIMIASLLCISFPLSSYAKNGAVIGKIYSTDILATVNGYPITSFNIGGRTCICVEDLKGYGFDVSYNDDSRTLNAEIVWNHCSADYGSIPRGTVGNVTGKIYKTDITANINGQRIESYNIGGYTCVAIEDLGNLEGSPNTKYGFSKYFMNCNWDNDKRVIALNVLCPTQTTCLDALGIRYNIDVENEAEGKFEMTGSTIEGGELNSKLSDKELGKMIPLRLYVDGKATDRIVGYAYLNNYNYYLDNDALKKAAEDGLYHKTTYEERIKEVEINQDIGLFHLLNQFDTDTCTIIYACESNSHGADYPLYIIHKDGSLFVVTKELAQQTIWGEDYPLSNLKLNADKTILYFDRVINDVTYHYQVDLDTDTLSEMTG